MSSRHHIDEALADDPCWCLRSDTNPLRVLETQNITCACVPDTDYNLCFCPTQLAEVKVRILEAKQTLEECITAQDFSRAAKLKDSVTELEGRRNQILKEIEESSQGADKEVRSEKVRGNTGNISLPFSGRFFRK